MKKAILFLVIASVSLFFLIIFVFFSFNDGKLHLVICDVGQGDAIFITTPSEAQILIDGGPDKKVLTCLASNMPFWDRSLDAIILTHPDADHVSGLVDVIQRYRVNNFFTEIKPGKTQIYELFTNVLAEEKLSAKYLARGDRLKFKDGSKLTIFSPASKVKDKIDQKGSNIRLNEYSVVALLTYGNFSALLTGDIGSKTIDPVANDIGDVDVLKVPHHGSKTGMSDNFLSAIKPELAIISVGAKNRYGHPAKMSLELLSKHKIKTLRTDQEGEIDIISDGKIWYVVE